MKLNQHILLTLTLTLLLNSPNLLWGQTSASQPVTSSGKEFMVPKKEVNGKLVGQEDVLIQEVVVTDSDRRYRRLDVGVSGTIDGWVVKEGSALQRRNFGSAPEFTFTQVGKVSRRFHGIVRYEASKGMGMTLIYPEAGTGWNKKLFVTVLGSGLSFLEGTLKPWNKNFDPSDPLGDIGGYERLMLDKGYAIAKTRRNASGQTGDYSMVLDDGEILTGKNVDKQPGLLLSFAQLAENLLKARLGQKPLRTYWYGHSSGGMNGRLVNYVRGLNVDENGGPIIDGFLNDDSGAGLYLPVLEENGRDTLFVTEKERQRFVKTIEITHQLYIVRMNTNRSRNLPRWVSPVYLVNKRMNAKILREKGLGDKSRMYEVRGVSHRSGERGILEDGWAGDVTILDLSRIMDALIDVLDNWVEKDIAPPPSKSDWFELGDIDGDGVIEHEAIALPEVACPLGLYYPYPYPLGLARTGPQYTGFASFDGQSLEPLDGRGVFVDMNLNRYLDHRESVDQAWHRLGILKPGEKFSRSKYQACVEAAVDKLKQEKLITERVAARYSQQASVANFPGQ